jgi:hypothetical protein
MTAFPIRRLASVLAVFSIGCAAHHVPPSQLFVSTCNRYASAQRYEDVGTIDTTYPSKASPFSTDTISDRTVRARFRTAFRRPGSMRIDFETLPPPIPFSFTIWSQKSLIRDWSTLDSPSSFATIGDALAAYQGVSSLGSYVVPQLLVGGKDSLCKLATVVGEGAENFKTSLGPPATCSA